MKPLPPEARDKISQQLQKVRQQFANADAAVAANNWEDASQAAYYLMNEASELEELIDREVVKATAPNPAK